MSSENEIVDQAGNNEPEIETGQQQMEVGNEPVVESEPEMPENAETAVSLEEPRLSHESLAAEPEPTEEAMAQSEDGWDAWISANPEEEMVETAVEVVVETGAVDQVQEDVVVEATEIMANVAAEENQSTDDGMSLGDAEEPIASAAPESESQETTEEASAEPNEPSSEASKLSSAKSQKSLKSRRDGLTVDHVITYFAPCGRCGFFLSGYRAAYGRDDLETAVSRAKSGWITLTWGQETQELVLKSFGSRIEENDLHFDGCCSECRRAYIYKSSRSESKPATFRIEIKPRKRQ